MVNEEIYKWTVTQFYLPECRSIRVSWTTRPLYEKDCKDHGQAINVVRPVERIITLVSGGGHVIVDYFDDQAEAEKFADRCWAQG